MMKFGSLIALVSVNQKNRSTLTWVLSGQSASSRQSGTSLSSDTGSITAPDRICAPTSEPFSTTTIPRSALSCFSRIAAARPDGPAPTITTSNSMDSRGGSSSVLMNLISARLRTSLKPVCFRFSPEEQPWNQLAGRFAAVRSILDWPNAPECSAMTPDRAPNVQQLLTFYLEAGVDCALVEEPVNRLSDPDIVPGPREIPAPHETPPPATVRTSVAAIPAARREPASGPEAAIQSAREAARTAPSLEALRALLEKFDGCARKFTATRLVFADGNPQARIMFVGEYQA